MLGRARLELIATVFLSVVFSGCSVLSGRNSAGNSNQCVNPAEIMAGEYQSEPRASLHIPSMPKDSLPEPVLERTPEVQRHIEEFSKLDGRYIIRGLCERDQHYRVLSQIFIDEGLPLTMLNLAMIESGYETSAKSSAGAVGMWQFMKSTARMYGLQIGLFVDERKDPILSTIAAARLLKDLYRSYNDWNLALAAYNAGSGAVNRAMLKTGVADFWTLARSGKLPRQTAEFVPRFIAASILVNEHLSGMGRFAGSRNGNSDRAGDRYTSAC